MRIGRHLRTARMLAVPVAVLAMLAGCGEDDQVGEPTSTTPTTVDSTTESTGSSTSSTEPAAEAVAAEVYFSRGEAVAAAATEVIPPATARGALDALLEGPDDVASRAGMTTAIPEGTELLGVDLADGLAVVDLSAEFVSGGGSLSMQMRAAQVVFTLTQFDSVDRVTFRVDGVEVDGLGGEGVPSVEVDRSDFVDVTPPVLVTSPLPGETAAFPMRVRGISNTFEANVLYELTTDDGTSVASGFTTATAGTGTWGEFDFEIAGDGVSAEDVLTLTLYEESMDDGGRLHVYHVPLAAG